MNGEKEEIMVYIGRSSTRYHRQRNCHYLFHDLKKVSAEDVIGLRSQEGKKYKPCASCKNRGTGAYVYVLPYGGKLSYQRGVHISQRLCTGSALKPGEIYGWMFVLQSIEVILACSHKISRKGRYRKASERILTEKGEEKVDVTLYIKAGFRIGFLLFLLSAAWQDLRKKSIRHLLFTSGE